ncbi:IS4 family transposase [Halococcus salifodinae]|uniref:ISH8-type transposase n=1 Tax=Halococcus salifodinae DSM 8989 TaxID=1227456 RepID=M0MTU4_9EURY|nr:IS4 family transposase [Halococcus salifodinae]EMA48184.1 ISH8-type transposase [Halococcus salifodinae DSM 8989]
MDELSSEAIRSLLTSLFSSQMVEDLAREREVVVRDRKIDVRMLVWTLVMGFAVGGEARSVAGYRRAYEAATDHSVYPSNFYDRFTEELATLLRDLLDHAVEEVAVPHTLIPAFEQFRDVIAVDATIVRLCRFLSEFKATHENESGLTLYLVHNVTEQSVISDEITDETTHESTLFETGSWLSGRLFLLDRGFFKFRRFALIDENGGFFVSRLKRSSNPVVTEELQEWPGRAIPLENERIYDVVGDLYREHIDVEVEVSFQRRVYDGVKSWDTKRLRVVGVRDEDADDGYRLYITNLPQDRFDPDEISTLYRARWVVELLFRELKSRYSLGKFETEKAHIVKIQVVAALLTLVVSRAILREFVEYAGEQDDECVFPQERWAATFRSLAQLILQEIAAGYGYPRPNLGEILYHEAKQPSPSRLILLQEVNAELCGDFSP